MKVSRFARIGLVLSILLLAVPVVEAAPGLGSPRTEGASSSGWFDRAVASIQAFVKWFGDEDVAVPEVGKDGPVVDAVPAGGAGPGAGSDSPEAGSNNPRKDGD